MEIASAYEVLGDEEQRMEYDALRSARVRRGASAEESWGKFPNHQQRYQYQDYQEEARRQYQEYFEYQQAMQEQYEQYLQQQQRQFEHHMREQQQYEEEMMKAELRRQEIFQRHAGVNWDQSFGYPDRENAESFMQEGVGNSYFKPALGGPFIPSGAVLFPYNPILVSFDESHFATLDFHCSLRVYEGSADEFVSYLLTSETLETSKKFEPIYSSPGDMSHLRGHCFASLDDGGVLRIYAGHPDNFYAQEMWASSTQPLDTDYYTSYYHRYYLELISGELFVLRLTAGQTESECVWATTSCNFYIALIKDVRSDVSKLLLASIRRVRQALSRVFDSLNFLIIDIREVWMYRRPAHVLKDLAQRAVFGIADFMKQQRAYLKALISSFFT